MRHASLPLRLLPLLPLLLVGCGEDDVVTAGTGPEPQAVSLLGDTLYSRTDESGVVDAADARLARAPDDLELLLAAGRARRTVWRYREAVELFGRAMEVAPDDWRPPRFRGHRYLSLREFDPGIRDLERARGLAPYNWDVAYHLGLGYFLAGRYGDATDEYLRCLGLADDPEARARDGAGFRSCSRNADDPESRVPMTEWAVRAAGRAGRGDVARRLLAELPTDLTVVGNRAYYDALLMRKEALGEEDLLDPEASARLRTVGFGLADWSLVRGDTAAALERLEEVARDPWWPSFERIAAEVDLVRLDAAGGG